MKLWTVRDKKGKVKQHFFDLKPAVRLAREIKGEYKHTDDSEWRKP